MTTDRFLEEDFRVLTPEAFEFVLTNELKRAVRSQNFVTLLLVEPALAGVPGGGNGEREQAVQEVARLIGGDVRETDLLSRTDPGQLSIVLLDSDLDSSMRVIDRLMNRLDHYQFARPLTFDVGAAACPTHGADAGRADAGGRRGDRGGPAIAGADSGDRSAGRDKNSSSAGSRLRRTLVPRSGPWCWAPSRTASWFRGARWGQASARKRDDHCSSKCRSELSHRLPSKRRKA